MIHSKIPIKAAAQNLCDYANVVKAPRTPGGTLKAFGQFQPRVAATLGFECHVQYSRTLKEFAKTPGQPFADAVSFMILWLLGSQGCSNPGLELANAFSVIVNAQSFHSLSSGPSDATRFS